MTRAALTTALIWSLGVAVAAHHGGGTFDGSKEIRLKGTFTGLDLINPHSWIYFEVPGTDGKVTKYRCEMRAATFTTEPVGDRATSYSRLVPPPGINEDPATGSAAGPAGCFMVKYGFVAADKAGSIVNVQGVLVKRPSQIHVKVASASGEIMQVKVGGSSVVVGEGTASV